MYLGVFLLWSLFSQSKLAINTCNLLLKVDLLLTFHAVYQANQSNIFNGLLKIDVIDEDFL